MRRGHAQRPGRAQPSRPATPRRALVLAGLLAPIAAGCTLLAPASNRTYHELRDLAPEPPATPRAQPGRSGPVLLVAVHQSSALYESSGIVYSRGDAGQSYYQLAFWTERPPRRLGLLAQRRLAAAAAANGLGIADAALDTSGVRGDWILGLRLAQLHHDTTSQPHRALIVVEADLLDWNERRMLDRAVFSATEALASEDVLSAVAAMNRGLTTVLDRIEEWLAARTGAGRDPR
jgi:ABC-type uncharacterized transport system auxiliary subunit